MRAAAKAAKGKRHYAGLPLMPAMALAVRADAGRAAATRRACNLMSKGRFVFIHLH